MDIYNDWCFCNFNWQTFWNAIAAIAAVATMIIAFLLYDRFGMSAKFIEKQTDKVFELADLLKGKVITIHTISSRYLLRPSSQCDKGFVDLPEYERDRNKIILMSRDDYERYFREILAIKSSYWLPKEIGEKMEFLDFSASSPIENSTDEMYVRFDFNASKEDEWELMIPKMKFEDFISNYSSLVQEINKWLKKHSKIPIDLKLDEPSY